MTARPASRRGALVAAALAGAWREKPPPPTLSGGELAEIAPLLVETACGALAWWRIRGTGEDGSAAAAQLRDAHRRHALQAAIHERELTAVVQTLAAAGIDALIVKGWAATRLYADPALRPYGDIDVCVAPDHLVAAKAALAASIPALNVDLVAGLEINQRVLPDLPSFEEAHARAMRVQLRDLEVPTVAPEDHLALLCVHLLSHGAWRPLWLCDVAAAVEQMPDEFDWDQCLGRSRRLATWVSATLTLAERLLGARIAKPPGGFVPTPDWVEPAVLRQWAFPRPDYPGDLVDLPPRAYLRPRQAARVVRAHWVNPISATMLPGAAFNAMPRLPYQLRFVAWKAMRFVRRRRAGTSTSPDAA